MRNKADTIHRTRRKRGSAPKPIEAFPVPYAGPWIDPPTFHEALALHAHRHGDSCWRLWRSVVMPGEKTDRKTLQDWMSGRKAPRSVQSLEILQRIEARYRLPDGYFREKLPHRSRAAHGHKPFPVSPSERRRLAWHLPDNFNSLPIADQKVIVEWVRRNIISGATAYREHLRSMIGQRYAIHFPALEPAPAGRKRARRANALIASPQLSDEMICLFRFKTSALTPVGQQRKGAWAKETAAQKLEHLGLMFGALVAHRQS